MNRHRPCSRRSQSVLVGAVLALTLALTLAASTVGAQVRSAHPGDWRSSGHDFANTGYNPFEDAISPDTAPDLERKWSHGPPSVFGTAVTADDIVYISDSAGFAHALDAETGSALWSTMFSDGTIDPIYSAATSTAPFVTDNALYVGDHAARVHRIDRETGAVEWSTEVEPNPSAYIQGDPTVFNGRLMVGVASFENGVAGIPLTVRGSVVAVDARTGLIEWQTYTTSDQSVPDPRWGAGVGVWSTPAIDVRSQRLYIGTGQHYEPGSDDPSPSTANDPDYSDSLLQLVVRSGRVRRQRQFTEGDVWGAEYPGGSDFDVGAPPNLFRIGRGPGLGRRPVVGVGDKEGTYYVMDRRSMEVIWSRRIAQGSVVGGIQSTAAYAHGVVYVAGHEYFDGTSFNNVIPEGQSFAWLTTLDGIVAQQNLARVNLLALDAATGDVIWSRAMMGGVSFAPLVLANGVLFFADAGGRLLGLDASSGAELFSDRLSDLVSTPDGGVAEIGKIITALSVSRGQLYVSAVGVAGPGGLTAYGLPAR